MSDSTVVINSINDTTIIVTNDVYDIVEIGTQGPPGPQGPRGEAGSVFIPMIAGENIGGNRVVKTVDDKAFYASRSAGEGGDIIGISVSVASINLPIDIASSGTMVEQGWNWTPNMELYLDENGLMTQIAPTTGTLIVVGIAMTDKKININISNPIIL